MADSEQQTDCVLVVDGDVLIRHAIADYLRHCGYLVIEAASTNEALVVLSERTVGIGFVICDAEAPGEKNAFELRAWALRERPELPVSLAGSIEAATNKAADLCDSGPHLRRPYDPQSVADYIRRLLGGRRSSLSA